MLIDIKIKTRAQTDFVDITPDVQAAVDRYGVKEGLCYVYIPHTTAAVTINENADPDVIKDIISRLDKVVPLNGSYRHAEGNSAAHIKSSIIGSSNVIFIHEGKLVLGTWQSIFLCEFDGPRSRKILVKVVKE